MKKVIYILAFSIPLVLQAQNYQNICTPGTTFFKDTEGNVKAFRMDSVYSQGNNDTLFISYRTIRILSMTPGCRDTTYGSIMGRKIYKKQNGWFCLFNWNNDSIKVNTQAALNETWKFCLLTNENYIQAEVTAIITDSIIGFPDQVKIITLQAKDKSGQNISHILNQKTIHLSKHYGFTKLIDLYFVPYNSAYSDTTAYVIAGKTQPVMGLQYLTWQQVFDFNTGDEFHYQGQEGYADGTSTHWHIIKRILSKTIYGNYDSITYGMEFCKIQWIPQPPPNIWTTFDTITETINLTEYLQNSSLICLPEEFLPTFTSEFIAPSFQIAAGSFNLRTSQKYLDRASVYWYWNQCWGDPFEGEYETFEYTRELGLTFHQYVLADMNTWYFYESLVFFKKVNETWGTPVSNDCPTLVPVISPPAKISFRVIISPNPVTRTAIITIDGCSEIKDLNFEVFDNVGRKVVNLRQNANTFTFDRQDLPNGFYIYMVSGKELNLTGKLILE